MGHSASIQKKYSTRPQKGDDEGSEHESLATVSSFRPNSPFAHTDAKEFTFGPQGSATRSRGKMPLANQHGYYEVNGTIPRRTLSSQRNITASSSTLVSQPRSMRELKHFLVRNPELLEGKHAKNLQKRNQFADIYPPKQIKTKQDLYLGLFYPPIVYGKGAEPEKQLKMNQRLYLQLIYPTVSGMNYNYPPLNPHKPVNTNEMVVVRREDFSKQDFSRQEDYLKKPPRVRSRPPLKPTEASPRSQSQQQILLEPSQHKSLSPNKSPRIPNGYVLPSSTPVRETHVPKRRANEYVDVNLPKPSASGTGKHNQKGFMEVERRYETSPNQGRESNQPKTTAEEDEIVFNYDVEELGLKKRTGAFPKDRRDDVVPLYFRKSLAYNPNYSNGGNILSDPL